MQKCRNCGKEVEPGKFCSYCGKPLLDSIIEENRQNNENQIAEQNNSVVTQNNSIVTQEQELKKQSAQADTYQQNNYQQANNQQQNNTYFVPKSQIVAIILSVIWPGLGHIYVGKTTDGLILMIVYAVMVMFAILIIPGIIALLIWLYAVIKSYEMVEKYNQGVPY